MKNIALTIGQTLYILICGLFICLLAPIIYGYCLVCHQTESIRNAIADVQQSDDGTHQTMT